MSGAEIHRLPAARQRHRSDAALMRACQEGDTGALGEVFDRYHADVHRFVLRMVFFDRADADDLVQQTFLAALKAAGRYDGQAPLRSWLLGVAANVTRHHRRGIARRTRLRDSVALEPLGPAPTPEALVDDRQRMHHLEMAIARLPLKYREAFVLCKVEGVPCAEAALAVGVPLGTLYRRVHEAQKRILNRMKRVTA